MRSVSLLTFGPSPLPIPSKINVVVVVFVVVVVVVVVSYRGYKKEYHHQTAGIHDYTDVGWVRGYVTLMCTCSNVYMFGCVVYH